MLASLARLVRISNCKNHSTIGSGTSEGRVDTLQKCAGRASLSALILRAAQLKRSHLERLDVRGVGGSHVEALHVGLEHALRDCKRGVICILAADFRFTAPPTPTCRPRLTFLCMDMVAMF